MSTTNADLMDPKNLEAVNAELAALAEKTDPKAKEATAGTDPVVDPKVENTEPQITEWKMEVEIAPGKSIFVTGKSEAEVNLKAEIAQQAAAAVIAAQKPPVAETPKEEKKGITAEEKVALQMKLQAGQITTDEYLDQSGAFDDMLKKRGLDPEKINAKMAEDQSKSEETAWQLATDEFKSEHPEYLPSKRNHKLLGMEILHQRQADPTLSERDAIEKAYNACLQEGDDYLDARTTEEAVVTPPVVEPPAPPKKKAASSAMFGTDGRSAPRGGAVKPVAMPEITREQWAAMSPAQQADWYNQAIARSTGQKAPEL